MQTILSNYTASITEFKKSPIKLLEESGNEVIAILNHNTPSAYLVSSAYYEKIMEIVDDYYLAQEIQERLNDGEKSIRVNIDDL